MTFYGMMILEGVIAMIWAAAALTIYNLDGANLGLPGPVVLGNIANHFLGRWMGGVTVAAIVILAITSGDTALRSSRLTFAEELRIDQKNVHRRILTTLPFIFIIAGLLWWSNASAKTFGLLWNYFAWGNQIIAVTMLMSATVWLIRQGRGAKSAVTLLPGAFMCTVVMSFILWASPAKGQVWGAGLSYDISLAIGVLISGLFAAYVVWRGHHAR